MIPYQVLNPFVPEKWCLELDPASSWDGKFSGANCEKFPPCSPSWPNYLRSLEKTFHQSQLPVVELPEFAVIWCWQVVRRSSLPSKQQGFAICPHPKHGQKQLNYSQKVCRYRRSKDGNQQKIPRKPLISIFFWVAHPSATLKKNHKPHPLGCMCYPSFWRGTQPPEPKKTGTPKTQKRRSGHVPPPSSNFLFRHSSVDRTQSQHQSRSSSSSAVFFSHPRRVQTGSKCVQTSTHRWTLRHSSGRRPWHFSDTGPADQWLGSAGRWSTAANSKASRICV